jgi:hypothetical protein
MKKLYICLTLVLAITLASCPLQAAALASEQSPLLITEVQPGTPANASEEFIELYNASSVPIDLDAGRWRIEIASSTATNWVAPIRTVQLTGLLAPGHTYIAASKYTNKGASVQYLPDVMGASFSAGISASAGHVRLVYVTNDFTTGGVCTDTVRVADIVEWSWLKLGVPAAPSIDGRGSMLIADSIGISNMLSLQRTVDATTHLYIDTDVDNSDFVLATPTPGEVPVLAATTATPLPYTCTVAPDPSPVPSEPPSPPADTGSDGEGDPNADGHDGQIPEPTADSGLLPPTITELLPNPAPPQTDSDDEFIELYNANDVALDVSSFVLEVGTTTKHRYTLPAGTILPPKSWTPFYSEVTGLSMANSGGQAQLYNAVGTVVATADTYGTAPDGQAWAYNDGSWQWTTTPTPGVQNITTVAPLPPKKAIPAVAAVKKTAAVKAATTTKAIKAAVKAPKATKPAKTSNAAFTPVATTARNPLHTGVLAAVGVFAISYGAYEYRSDIANKFHQLRSYRAARRSNRPGIARRRNN